MDREPQQSNCSKSAPIHPQKLTLYTRKVKCSGDDDQVLPASPPAINSSMNTSSVHCSALSTLCWQHFGMLGTGEHPMVACEICSECSLITTTGMGRGAASSVQAPCTESDQALAVSSSASPWQLCSNMHDTCHAHVNSVMPNDMQAEDKLAMRSSLWCQLTDLGKVGNWSLLQYLHSSHFLP